MKSGPSVALFCALLGLMGCEDATRDDVADRTTSSPLTDPYTAIMLPDEFTPVAVNQSLTVVGTAYIDGDFKTARWTPDAGTTRLQVGRGWSEVSVRDLNERGQVAGVAGVGNTFHAVRWEADGTPRALGLAYYVAGSSLDDAGAQAWVLLLGSLSNPTGYDIRYWSGSREISRGKLPFQPNDNGDQFAPFRLKEGGVMLWGFGRWLYRPGIGWKELAFPPDVTSGASLTDANRSGDAIGTGFSQSANYYRGFSWDNAGRRIKLGDKFLPQFITTEGLLAGHLINPAFDIFPAQIPGLSDHRGTFASLPIPPAPANFVFAYGWVFDMTDDGTAVGSVLYYDLRDPNDIHLAGGGVLWVKREIHPESMASLSSSESRINPVSPNFRTALCNVPAAASSSACAKIVTPLSRMKRQ